MEQLVFKRNLVYYKSYICRKFAQELDVGFGVRAPARFLIDDQDSQGLLLHKKRESQHARDALELLPGGFFARIILMNVARTQRQEVPPRP